MPIPSPSILPGPATFPEAEGEEAMISGMGGLPPPEAAVRIKAADGQWLTLGRDPLQGIVPEGITLSANQGGPDTAGFTLRRRADVLWPDLLAFNQCEIEIGNSVVWGGRIWEAPLSDGGEYAIGVQGRGWQSHLDDDLVRKFYVHDATTAHVDQRSKPAANLTDHRAGPQIQAGDGVVTLIFPLGYTVPVSTGVTVTFDAGASLISRAIVVWSRIGGLDGNMLLISRLSTSESASAAGDDTSVDMDPATSGTLAHTAGALRRYHHVIFFRQAAGGVTMTEDSGVRITAIRLFGSTSYESGNVSVLKASQVVTDVLGSGALPLLSTATDLIGTTSFSIPHHNPGGFETPRSLIQAASAYETSTFGVNAVRKLFYRPLETKPTIEVGQWSGSEFRDATSNSAEGLYNKVIVQGTGPDGTPVSEERTASSGLLTRQGFTRTATLNISGPITTTGAQQLGDIWLSERSSPPFKGSLTVNGFGGARLSNGSGINPHELLLHFGKRIRLGHLVDPATGGWGRDGMIASVTYNHDENTASVEIDNERGRFEALLSRLAVVVGQITI